MNPVISRLQKGQLLSVRKRKFQEGKNYLLLSCGVPGYTFLFHENSWPDGFNPKEDYVNWIKIAKIDEDADKVYISYADGKEQQIEPVEDAVFLGRIFEASKEGCKVSISDQIYVNVPTRKYGDVADEVAKGVLCVVVIDKTDGNRVFGRIVCTEKSSFDLDLEKALAVVSQRKSAKEKALEPKEDLPEIIFIEHAMNDALRDLDLPRTEENIAMIEQRFKEDYKRAYKNKAILRDSNLRFKGGAHENDKAAHYSFESSLVVQRPLGQLPLTFGFKTKLDEDIYIVERCGLKTKNLHTILQNDIFAEDWDVVVDDLANMAIKEDWGEPKFGSGRTLPHPILNSYLTFTYYVAKTQGRVVRKESGASNLTIFNTGLVDDIYEYIYAVMEDSHSGTDQALTFLGFATVGNGMLGKRISKLFDELPDRVQYIQDANDLFLDTKAAMYDCDIDMDHMATPDRLKRLPLSFLRYICVMDDKASEILAREDRGKWKALADRFNDKDCNLKFRLSEEIRKSKDMAVKRTEWNYKTAIPVYFAARHTLSTIIPLTLPYTDVATGRVDAALVLSHNKDSGRYQAETILTLEMAYSNSRQIARPDSDWLLVPREDGADAE